MWISLVIEAYLPFRYCWLSEGIDDLIADPLMSPSEDVQLIKHSGKCFTHAPVYGLSILGDGTIYYLR